MKTCMKCNLEKELDDFYKHKGMADGHLNKCKECAKADVKKNRDENIEYYRQYQNDRYRNEKLVRDRITESAKKWAVRNPIKRGAQTMVNNAVRDGRLVKSDSCQECGCVHKRIHGHHDDYSKPLEVRWLCPSCHRKWHLENGEGKHAF